MKKSLLAVLIAGAAILLSACTSSAKQHAQAAKSTHAFKWGGMKITIRGEILDVDGVLGALDENEPQAKVYSQGLYTFIYYPAKGKLAVSKEGQFQGYARKIK